MRKRIIILEGPDGGGKSTLAAELSSRFGVQVDKHGPYQGEHQIWRHYFESMLPAYSGERDVILDRSWISEPIYGKAYRKGFNRIEHWQLSILEYVMQECNCTVIWCLPTFEKCRETFRDRRGKEMLENEGQLLDVYNQYRVEALTLPGCVNEVLYDYTLTTHPWKEQL